MLFTLAASAVIGSLALAQAVSAGPLDTRNHKGSIPEKELFASCPGGPGSSLVKRADRCVLKSPVRQPDVRYWAILGSPQLNCGGGTEPIEWTIGGSTTVTTSTTVDASLGFSFEGLSIGASVDSTESNSVTADESVKVTILPGKQAVHVAGINHRVYSSNVQVNYPDRQFGHYEWYTRAIVTRRYPVKGDVHYDTHFSDCGTDPTKLDK